MNLYVKSGIAILNDTTKNLKDLNELGIYLSKQTNIDALKSLKLLILASESSRLNKDLDINHIKSYPETLYHDTYTRNESIVGNLSMNPQNLALDLMDYILHHYKVDLTVHPYGKGSTIFALWAGAFVGIGNEENTFYNRYDMTNKRLEIISYMIENDLLDAEEIEFLSILLDRCIQKKYAYTSEHLLKMQEIFNNINFKKNLKLNITNLIAQDKIQLNCSQDELIKELLLVENKKESSDKTTSWDKLSNYFMLNDQCLYMLQTIPTLVKKKIIH